MSAIEVKVDPKPDLRLLRPHPSGVCDCILIASYERNAIFLARIAPQQGAKRETMDEAASTVQGREMYGIRFDRPLSNHPVRPSR